MNSSSRSILHFRSARRAMAGAVLIMAAAMVPRAGAQTVLPADAKPSCTVPGATFATWFKAGAVALDGEVNPANSVTFPDVPNCSFYQWSHQMFLWLNSPTPATYGGGGGRIFDSPVFFDVSAPDANGDRHFIAHHAGQPKFLNVRMAQVGPNGLPVVFDKAGTLFEVAPAPVSPNGKSLIRDLRGKMIEIERIDVKANKAVFLDRQAKPIAIAPQRKIDSLLMPNMPRRLFHNLIVKNTPQTKVLQSFKNGPRGATFFIDAAGNIIDVGQGQAGGDAVLMAQNGSLVYYATTVNDVFAYFATGAKNGSITPADHFPTSQADLNKVVTFAQAHGKTFPDPEALAIEVKSAWIEPIGLDASKYISATAVVPTYDQSNNLSWTPTGTKTVKLILVGMHVVGSTKGHPEMLWATFEHFTNTPNPAFSYINTGNQTVNVPQSPTGSWLFSSTNSPLAAYNIQRIALAAPNIVAKPSKTIGASDTIRWKAFGAAGSPAASNTEIISINNSVLGQLAAGDVRGNYMMTGTTWTIFGAAPAAGNQVGTSHLANTTMETYQQGINTLNNGSNCFSCHTSNQVGVSNIFNELKPLFP